MKKELNLLFNALLFYTRIPVPFKVDFSREALTKSFRYFPLAGVIAGSSGIFVYFLASYVFTHPVAVMAAFITLIITTGAMHEDGLADFLDGYGGGADRDSILRIMKESTIGVYGVIGTVSNIILKFLVLCSFPHQLFITAFISAQAISRIGPIYLVNTSVYARDEKSKADHTRHKTDKTTTVIATLIALLPLLLFNPIFSVAYLVFFTIMFISFRRYLHKRTGGFTGDTLGALQQLSELLFYLTLAASINLLT